MGSGQVVIVPVMVEGKHVDGEDGPLTWGGILEKRTSVHRGI